MSVKNPEAGNEGGPPEDSAGVMYTVPLWSLSIFHDLELLNSGLNWRILVTLSTKIDLTANRHGRSTSCVQVYAVSSMAQSRKCKQIWARGVYRVHGGIPADVGAQMGASRV